MLRSLLLFILLVAPFGATAAPAQDDVAAAMVFRLTKFVEWPEGAFLEPSSKFRICFDQPSPIFDKLSAAKLKRWQGREVGVTDEITDQCHVAVISPNGKAIQEPMMLTIGSDQSFLDDGGHVKLEFKSGRVIFSVNRTKATEAGLIFSSDLLSLAREVK